MRDHADRRSSLGRVLESNERRLDALHRQGVRVAVDGPAVLQFLFDRALTTRTPRELRLSWGLNVAGLLKQAEAVAAHEAAAGRRR